MDWLLKVQAGDFDVIPANAVTYREACELALLFKGYEVAGGVVECMEISRRVVDGLYRKDAPQATALDLWTSLFALQRSYRFCGLAPDKEGTELFQELVRQLRVALTGLNAGQRAGIISALGRDEVLG